MEKAMRELDRLRFRVGMIRSSLTDIYNDAHNKNVLTEERREFFIQTLKDLRDYQYELQRRIDRDGEERLQRILAEIDAETDRNLFLYK